MGNIIELIAAADSPVLIVVLSFILVYLFVKGIYQSFKWVVHRLNGYHQLKSEEETIEERISKLEKHDKGQYQKLTELGDEMKKIIAMIQKVQDTQARTIVDTYRNSIFAIYHECIEKGNIKQTQLDRFLDLVKRYKEAGGDGIVDQKIYPQILDLPIIHE